MTLKDRAILRFREWDEPRLSSFNEVTMRTRSEFHRSFGHEPETVKGDLATEGDLLLMWVGNGVESCAEWKIEVPCKGCGCPVWSDTCQSLFQIGAILIERAYYCNRCRKENYERED